MARKFYNEDQYNELLTRISMLESENSRLKSKLDFAGRLDSLEKFAELVEDIQTDLDYSLMQIKSAIVSANSFDEFKGALYRTLELKKL